MLTEHRLWSLSNDGAIHGWIAPSFWKLRLVCVRNLVRSIVLLPWLLLSSVELMTRGFDEPGRVYGWIMGMIKMRTYPWNALNRDNYFLRMLCVVSGELSESWVFWKRCGANHTNCANFLKLPWAAWNLNQKFLFFCFMKCQSNIITL